MSEEFDLNAALSDDNVPAALRDWAKNVQKTNKTLADELAGFKTQQRSNTLTSALKDAGVSEKIARFYPADKDVDGPSVAAWLKDNADVFGQPAQATESVTTNATQNTQTGVTVADIAAMQRVQNTTPSSGGNTPTLADRVQKIDGLKMRSAEDRAELDAFNRELQEMARMAIASSPYSGLNE